MPARHHRRDGAGLEWDCEREVSIERRGFRPCRVPRPPITASEASIRC